jgi:hypothetical protein
VAAGLALRPPLRAEINLAKPSEEEIDAFINVGPHQ